MKILLFLTVLLSLMIPQQSQVNDASAIAVLSYKWMRARRVIENPEADGITPPASAMIAANKNFARNVRVNDPQGVRDPNADTLDGRSAQMEKNVQEARSPRMKPVDGFSYRIKVQNNATNAIEVLFWEYQFSDGSNQPNVTRHQFICGVSIRPGKDKELEGFSMTSPGGVINVDALTRKSPNPLQENVVINRVEYADGSMWQRSDWSLKEVKPTYERALKEPWLPGMCKTL